MQSPRPSRRDFLKIAGAGAGAGVAYALGLRNVLAGGSDKAPAEVIQAARRVCEGRKLTETPLPHRIRYLPKPKGDWPLTDFRYLKDPKVVFIDFHSAKQVPGTLNTTDTPAYVISPLVNTAVVSQSYNDCTAVAASGTAHADDPTGQSRWKKGDKIGFLTHQYPPEILGGKAEQFRSHMHQRLDELSASIEPGTISYAVLGGKYSHLTPWVLESSEKFSKRYVEGLLRVLEITGSHALTAEVEPVMIGPMLAGSTRDIRFDVSDLSVRMRYNEMHEVDRSKHPDNRSIKVCKLPEFLTEIEKEVLLRDKLYK